MRLLAAVKTLLIAALLLTTSCGGQSPDATTGEVLEPSGPEVSLRFERNVSVSGSTASPTPTELLAGLPGTCRLLKNGDSADADLARRITDGVDPSADPGPLVAVDASPATAVVATTLYTPDEDQGESASWTVDVEKGVIAAASDTASAISRFPVDLVDSADSGPLPSALAEATDCSWVAADRARPDPPKPEPQLRPDLMVLEPDIAAPGEVAELHFPQETPRGVAFRLDRKVGDTWEPGWLMRATQGEQGIPKTVPVGTDFAFTDVGIGGAGPDRVLIPEDVAPGRYRVCTANAGDDFCAALAVSE